MAALPVAELARRKRFLMHLDARGQVVLSEVPDGALVASPEEWTALIADPGALFDREALPAIITAAAQRLGKRQEPEVRAGAAGWRHSRRAQRPGVLGWEAGLSARWPAKRPVALDLSSEAGRMLAFLFMQNS